MTAEGHIDPSCDMCGEDNWCEHYTPHPCGGECCQALDEVRQKLAGWYFDKALVGPERYAIACELLDTIGTSVDWDEDV